jgi:glycosyltransferase involved in cell wall biosynthesis
MAADNPKILLVIPHLGVGGAQNVFRQQREFLYKRFSVSVCVFNRDHAGADDQFEAISLDVPGGNTWLQKMFFFGLRVLRLRQIKTKEKFDVCISHLEGADYVNLLSKRQERIFLWIHGTKALDRNISGLPGWLRKRVLIPWLYRRADHIICVSQGIASELRADYPGLNKKLAVIHNGFDFEALAVQKAEPAPGRFLSLCEKYFVVITHCRLAKQKNLPAFIRLAHSLRHRPEIKWVILGDGEKRETLLSLCQAFDLPTYRAFHNDNWEDGNTLFFLGHQPNPFPFLTAANLYLMTSDWEGFPLALCEAMACGTPVVATDCPTGPAEILAGRESQGTAQLTEAAFGFLAPLLTHGEAIDGTARALEELLDRREFLRNLGLKGAERVRHFSIEKSFGQLIDLIQNPRT